MYKNTPNRLPVSLENNTCIGTTKTVVVTHYRHQIWGFAAFEQDGKAVKRWVENLNVGRACHKAVKGQWIDSGHDLMERQCYRKPWTDQIDGFWSSAFLI